MPKITDKFIHEIQSPEQGQKLFWDSDLKGFGLRVTKTKKSFIAQGLVNGKDRRVKIASVDRYSASEARKLARKCLQQMAEGIDPNMEKKKIEAISITLEKVAEDYKKNKKTRDGHSLKESSKADIDKHLKKVFAEWADKPIANITREAVLNKYRDAAKSSVAQANQAFRVLRALYNWARATTKQEDGTPLIPENPVQALNDLGQWGYVPTRNGRIPDKQIGVAWNYLQSVMSGEFQTKITHSKAAYLCFLLLTGCRAGEAAELRWTDVDLEKEIWILRDPKNRNPVTLPLSSQAKAVLESRPKDSEFIFTKKLHKAGGRVHFDTRHLLNHLSTEIKEKITPHDLRRTFRAAAGASGVEFWKTKLLMNHKLNHDVTISAYTDTSDLRYLQPDIQQIGDWIERQGRIAAQEKVVDLDQARREKQAVNAN